MFQLKGVWVGAKYHISISWNSWSNVWRVFFQVCPLFFCNNKSNQWYFLCALMKGQHVTHAEFYSHFDFVYFISNQVRSKESEADVSIGNAFIYNHTLIYRLFTEKTLFRPENITLMRSMSTTKLDIHLQLLEVNDNDLNRWHITFLSELI